MKNSFLLLSGILLLICLSCKQTEQQKNVSSVLTEWVDKTIVLPDTVYMPQRGTIETVNYECYEYKILNYMDSIGCVSCDLRLTEWNVLYKELKEKGMSVIPIFVFGISNNKKFEKEIYPLLKHNAIAFPIIIDSLNQVNNLNKFPNDRRFQTFLLNKKNEVIVVGNPIFNPHIRDLYFNIISKK